MAAGRGAVCSNVSIYSNFYKSIERFEGNNKRIRDSEFTPTAKDSIQRESIAYICGLRARIECEPRSEHSTRSDRVTNIGYALSLDASPCLQHPRILFIILPIKSFIPRLAVDKFRMVFGIDNNLFFIQSMIARKHIADGDSNQDIGNTFKAE